MVRPNGDNVDRIPLSISHLNGHTQHRVHFSPVVSQLRYNQVPNEVVESINENNYNNQRITPSIYCGRQVERVRVQQLHRPPEEKVQKVILTSPLESQQKQTERITSDQNIFNASKNDCQLDKGNSGWTNEKFPEREHLASKFKKPPPPTRRKSDKEEDNFRHKNLGNWESESDSYPCRDNLNATDSVTTVHEAYMVNNDTKGNLSDTKRTSWKSGFAHRFSLLKKFVGGGETLKTKEKSNKSIRASKCKMRNNNSSTTRTDTSQISAIPNNDILNYETTKLAKHNDVKEFKEKTPPPPYSTIIYALNGNDKSQDEKVLARTLRGYSLSTTGVNFVSNPDAVHQGTRESYVMDHPEIIKTDIASLPKNDNDNESYCKEWTETSKLPKPSPRLKKFLFRSNCSRHIEGFTDATDELSANVEKILEEIAGLEHIMENSLSPPNTEIDEETSYEAEIDSFKLKLPSLETNLDLKNNLKCSQVVQEKPPLPPSSRNVALRHQFFRNSAFDALIKTPGPRPLKAKHKLMTDLDVKLSEFREEVHRSREEIAMSYPKLEEIDKVVRNSMAIIDRFGRNPQNSRISTSWESPSSTFSFEKNPSSSRQLRYTEQKLLKEWSSIISEAKEKLTVSTKNYNNEGTPSSNNFKCVLETDLDTGTSRELFFKNDTNQHQSDCSRKPEKVVKSSKENCIVKLVHRSACSMQNLNLEASSQMSTLSPCDPKSKEDRSRSMEFLDDEKNSHLLPPENTLKKNQESRQASEHELRIQRSLQRLNVPDWYKKYATPSCSDIKPAPKEFSSGLAGGWQGLGSSSKTSSLTSLQSAGRYPGSRTQFSSRHKSPGGTASTGGRSSRESLMSPSSTASASPSPYYERSSFTYGMPYALSRFATARMSCGASPASLSPSPSPVGGITSSTSTPVSSGPMSRYGYNKTPYLGWRSQERLTSKSLYRSPAERLAADLHAQKQKVTTPVSDSEKPVTASNITIVTSPRKESASDLSLNTSDESNKLNRVRSSIKEVSNAIVDYVNETKPLDDSINGRASPRRGLIWLESSFVGTKPIDSPGTPDTPSVILSSGRHLGSQGSAYGKRSSLKLDEQNGDKSKDLSTNKQGSDTSQGFSSYLSRNEKMGERSNSSSVSSPTLEDILDSLLALRRPHKKIRSRGKGHKESLTMTETEPERFSSAAVSPTLHPNPYETPISDWQERMNQPLDDCSTYFPADTDTFVVASTTGTNNDDEYEKISYTINKDKNISYKVTEVDENDGGESQPDTKVAVKRNYRFEIVEDDDDVQGRIAQEETSFGIPTEIHTTIPNIYSNPLAGLHDSSNPPTPARHRRVSFDLDISDKDEKSSSRSRRDESIGGSIQCRNSKCGKTATGLEARREFKTCHNCNAYYCCRECRRIHWEKHKKVCMQSRVGQLCKQIIGHVKDQSFVVSQLSTVAKRGYLAKGRGCVKLFFSSPDRAERFLTGGLPELPEPWYIPHSDMLPEEMGAPTFAELSENCRSYNPETRFVLYSSVCVVNEVPTSGAVKWEREMISRSAKIRLLLPRTFDEHQPHHHAAIPAHLNAEDIDCQAYSPTPTAVDDESTIENSAENETLILRSVPTPASLKLNSSDDRRRREVSFTNIQKHLVERGVDLRRTYPDIYSKLCNYVENDEPFLPVTIYPRNSNTGCQFMCVIMPESSSDTTDGISSDPSRKVETINISEQS